MALYNSTGKISEISEVKSGTGKSGNKWQRCSLIIEIPGYQGSVTKQVFSVIGDDVDDILQQYHVGDQVEVSWTIYAREWNGRWYNNVDLVKIKHHGDAELRPAPAAPKAEESLDPAKFRDDLPF